MTDAAGDHCCKVGRVTERYDLEGVDDRLAGQWRDGQSVRELTEALNADLVDRELAAAEATDLSWSVSPILDALQSDDLPRSETLQIRRELDRLGVDVEALADRFVSHQTVYRHLTDCLGVSKDSDTTPEDRVATATDTVQALQQRTQLVTESTLERLQSAGDTTLGDFDVFVELTVFCSSCNRSMDFETAVNNGCDCNET